MAKSQTITGTEVTTTTGPDQDNFQYKEAMQTNRTEDTQDDRRSDQKSNSGDEGDLFKTFGQQKEDR